MNERISRWSGRILEGETESSVDRVPPQGNVAVAAGFVDDQYFLIELTDKKITYIKGTRNNGSYEIIEEYTRLLFDKGTKMARERGLILVDTKYEFGLHNGKIYLIDEIHTPDSSRYYFFDGYEERQDSGEKQIQLSKEFVREWLMAHGFQGKEDQLMPEMSDSFIWMASDRYIELYEMITGETFSREKSENISDRIYNNVVNSLNR